LSTGSTAVQVQAARRDARGRWLPIVQTDASTGAQKTARVVSSLRGWPVVFVVDRQL